MQLNSLDNGARKYGLHYSDTERYKTIFVSIPDIAAGNQAKIYLPYDQDLKNAIITGIRIGNGGGPSAPTAVWPPTYNNNNGFISAGQLAQFVLTIVNKKGVRIWKEFPLYFLLQTSTINQDVWVNCQFTFEPGMSYLSYFNTGSGYGKTVVPISFRYKSLII
jgi:hypothetical protein